MYSRRVGDTNNIDDVVSRWRQRSTFIECNRSQRMCVCVCVSAINHKAAQVLVFHV